MLVGGLDPYLIRTVFLCRKHNTAKKVFVNSFFNIFCSNLITTTFCLKYMDIQKNGFVQCNRFVCLILYIVR